MRPLRFLGFPAPSRKKGSGAAREFANMVGEIVNATVSAAPITVVEISGGEPLWFIAHCQNKLPVPLPLVNGSFLFLQNNLVLRRSQKYPATLYYKYQYQATEDPDSWIFRYEYEREPGDDYPYPLSHVHVNAKPASYDGVKLFPDLHLPVPERVTIEDVVRHLITEHDVGPISPTWEQTISETRGHFEEIQRKRLQS